MATDIERIANALERLVGLLERRVSPVSINNQPKKPTPFPWSQVSTRTKNAAVRFAKCSSKKFPLSCEDLEELGREEFLEIRDAGALGAEEISQLLQGLGFNGWVRAALKYEHKPKFKNPVIDFRTTPEELRANNWRPGLCVAARQYAGRGNWHCCGLEAISDELCRIHKRQADAKGIVACQHANEH